MVAFAGWKMPVIFSNATEEHLHVRKHVGIFDVSHMGEIHIQGEKALPLLTHLLTNNVASLHSNQSQYHLMCNHKGGILDDLIVYCLRKPSDYLLCVNALNQEKDFEWIVKNNPFSNKEVTVTDVSEKWGLLAVQGPKAEKLMQRAFNLSFTPNEIKKFEWTRVLFQQKELIVSRTGYTGEDGFEIFTPIEITETVWRHFFLYQKEVPLLPIGLSARNTLRLEMKYPLYEQDMDETVTPSEMGLTWACKNKNDFIGKSALLKNPDYKWVGFMMQKPFGIPRKGYSIFSTHHQLPHHQSADQPIGQVTGGMLSPCLNKMVGVGMVKSEFSAKGTPIEVAIHKVNQPALVVSTPFWKRASEE